MNTPSVLNAARPATGVDCLVCRNMRHVWNGFAFTRCPSCYVKNVVVQELRSRQYPVSWLNLQPEAVMDIFGTESPVTDALRRLLTGQQLLVHAYDLPTERRQAFVGALAHGFLRQGRGIQVLDSADLSHKHFSKDGQHWAGIERQREPVILTLGREVENRIGFHYLRQLLDRAVDHQLPLILVTDYPIENHAPRYPDLMAVIDAARFDVVNLGLGS